MKNFRSFLNTNKGLNEQGKGPTRRTKPVKNDKFLKPGTPKKPTPPTAPKKHMGHPAKPTPSRPQGQKPHPGKPGTPPLNKVTKQQQLAQKLAERNGELAKKFKGARTQKVDGKVKATKAWAEHLKKNGSKVIAKTSLPQPVKPSGRVDHINQFINSWAQQGKPGKPVHQHLGKPKPKGK